MKEKNEIVLVRRKYIVGELIEFRDKKIHITEASKNEQIRCSECGEIVRHHTDHYEHLSREGNPCKYKTN